ncbi:hypothetical protein [Macrococcus armenti]|nr:hypothetical protein [Macrococcus armenti]
MIKTKHKHLCFVFYIDHNMNEAYIESEMGWSNDSSKSSNESI